MTSAAQQNAMMLASLLGVGEDEAAERLARTVLVTAEPGWKTAWVEELGKVLGRTVTVVTEPGATACDVEIVIGAAEPRAEGIRIFADLDAAALVVAEERQLLGAGQPHGLYGAAAACAVSAAAVHAAIRAAELPQVRLPMKLAFADLGVPDGALDRPVELSDAFVAGAGAVAHGFLHAARHLDVRGSVKIVDPKTVKEGILNRCLYLGKDDIDADKAVALATKAQGDFPNLTLEHEVADLRTVLRDREQPPETIFITVDSRAARRSIQLEFPHRIIDGSTTDVTGVIVHSNTLPTEHACLACIYRHVPQEHSRELAVAAGLGVELAVVQRGFIDDDAARAITEKFPQIEPEAITGMAFDSLFRQLCSQQALTTAEGRQVLAPFAFVSAWAGVLMAVEMLRCFAGAAPTNYWRVDPWNVPIPRTRVRREKIEDCQFCSNPDTDRIIRDVGGWARELDLALAS